MRSERRYRFDPLDHAVFLGLTAAQCLLVGVGLVGGALSHTAGLPLAVSAGIVAGSALVAFFPIRGRPLCEWVSPAGRFATRPRRWLAPLPLLPVRDGQRWVPPACLDGLDVIEVPVDKPHGRAVGLVRDRRAATLTVLVPVRGLALALLGGVDQERALDGWGLTLAEFTAQRRVVRLSWSVFATPTDLASHRAWVASTGGEDATGPAMDSYRALVDEAAGAVNALDVVVTLTVAGDPGSRSARRRRPEDDDWAVEAALAAAETLARGLTATGLSVGDPLSPTAIWRRLAVRAEPTDRGQPEGGRLADRVGVHGGGPLAVAGDWSAVRIDGAFHRSFWIESWPGTPRLAGWLNDLLSPAGPAAAVTRAVTVHFVPERAEASARRIDRELAKHESDAEARDRRGRRTGAAHRRRHEAVLDREEELVAGDPVLRYCGVVCVSAGSADTLEVDCAAVEQAARSCGLGLRVLHGRQDDGWAASLPLGAGPRVGFTP